MAGWRFGGLRCRPVVVSMTLNLSLRSGGQAAKILLSSMLRRNCRVGSLEARKFQVSCSAMGPAVEIVPLEVASVGPVTLRMASRTRMSSSLLAFWPTIVWLGTWTWIESPETTSRVRTQRQRAPSEGVSFRMRISASKMSASKYLASVSAAEMRAVRLLPSVDHLLVLVHPNGGNRYLPAEFNPVVHA
jgi:hypothetical protein